MRIETLARTGLLAIIGLLLLASCGTGDDELDTATAGGSTGSSLDAFASQTAADQPGASTQGTSIPQPTPTAGGGESDVAPKQWSSPPAMQLEDGKDYVATIHTTKGDIVIDLDELGVPKTVNNFVFLANEGYYANVPFHRVVKGFVIQTGDPTGTGRGGPGYQFADEPVTKNYTRGTLAMANSGANTNGSQFFICLADLATLPKNYTIFGTVTAGMDVVDSIAAVPTTWDASGREQSVPTEPVTMTGVDIATK